MHGEQSARHPSKSTKDAIIAALMAATSVLERGRGTMPLSAANVSIAADAGVPSMVVTVCKGKGPL